MTRPIPGYVRPVEIVCFVCGGAVAVESRGRIPEGHAGCMQLRRDLTRLSATLDTVAEDRTPPELGKLSALISSELQQLRNSWVNRYANPARRAAAAADPRQPRLIGASRGKHGKE